MGFGPNTLSYDALNQLEVVGGGVLYAYDSDNRRMYMYENSGTETVYFYGVDGRKLATFGIGYANQSIQFTQESQNVYFAGFLVRAENAPARTDRLGSEAGSGRRYYPYGVEYNVTADDAEKYATYTRDGLTGLDYAMNRYCSSQWGRFLSPDPYLANTYFGSLWAEQLAPTLDAVTQYGNGQWVGGIYEYTSANIILQDSGPNSYLQQSAASLASTLIHELGHVFNIVTSLGGSAIQYDANPDGTSNAAAEAANATALAPCAKALGLNQ